MLTKAQVRVTDSKSSRFHLHSLNHAGTEFNLNRTWAKYRKYVSQAYLLFKDTWQAFYFYQYFKQDVLTSCHTAAQHCLWVPPAAWRGQHWWRHSPQWRPCPGTGQVTGWRWSGHQSKHPTPASSCTPSLSSQSCDAMLLHLGQEGTEL